MLSNLPFVCSCESDWLTKNILVTLHLLSRSQIPTREGQPHSAPRAASHGAPSPRDTASGKHSRLLIISCIFFVLLLAPLMTCAWRRRLLFYRSLAVTSGCSLPPKAVQRRKSSLRNEKKCIYINLVAFTVDSHLNAVILARESLLTGPCLEKLAGSCPK